MESIKWLFYKLLIKFIAHPEGTTPIHIPANVLHTTEYYWIFCSTIGELNGCRPLIKEIDKKGQIVLITDRDCYQEAFNQHFPNAIFIQLLGKPDESSELIKRFPPKSFYMCEIPCLPYDAPCRLSYKFLRDLKKHGCSLSVVNGWLYGYAPSCKQDAIEQRLFTKEYVNIFDLMCVQTEEVKRKLIEKGAKESKIHVTGNMKFDAISTEINVNNKVSQSILKSYSEPVKQIVVAGCVSEEWEYRLLINSFASLLGNIKDCVLVFAPRHPEKPDQLLLIETILQESELSFEFKSKIVQNVRADTQVLVLDTFGELRSFYSIADISYVGRNHNVLEPISFGKPVVILAGWETTYPSYPVYDIAVKNNLVTKIADQNRLSEVFKALLMAPHIDDNLVDKLKHLPSALQKNMTLLL